MNLPSLHGFVKFPEGFPAGRIKLEWTDYPAIAEPFQRKSEMQIAAYVPLQENQPADGGDGGPAPVATSVGEKTVTAVDGQAADQRTSDSDAAASISAREITATEQQMDTRAEGPATTRNGDETPTAKPPEREWRDIQRQNRRLGAHDGRDRTKDADDRETEVGPKDASQSSGWREQQITIEERTGQAYADPAERQAHHRTAAGIDGPQSAPCIHDDLDMGM